MNSGAFSMSLGGPEGSVAPAEHDRIQRHPRFHPVLTASMFVIPGDCCAGCSFVDFHPGCGYPVDSARPVDPDLPSQEPMPATSPVRPVQSTAVKDLNLVLTGVPYRA